MSALDQIKHVVVLMLENRSFDNLLGKLYPKTPAFDGLAGDEINIGPQGERVQVRNFTGTDVATMSIPDPDPGELFTDINLQIFGDSAAPPDAKATMGGFVESYLGQAAVVPGTYNASHVMNYFMPEQVPVISRLARQFAVCDRWFASAPCQTWPNRFFVHTGTANGFENNEPAHFPYQMPTIFNQFQYAGIPSGWKIYYHDFAQTWALAKLWLLLDHFHYYDQFERDAANGTLPAYAFIEPRYYPHPKELPNDQHPPHVVSLGEQLIADVYNALRSGPAWRQTLLIITYDEHGGCYDHVAPPAAHPPGAVATSPFNFDRYGVRVPAVIVSPYIAPGTVLRPLGDVPYDHTSVLATLRKCFPALGAPLSLREAAAPDLGTALTLQQPTNLGPPHLEALPFTPTPSQVAKAQMAPLNGMQKALATLAANLPVAGPADDFGSVVQNHIHTLTLEVAKRIAPAGAATTMAGPASAYISSRVAPFLAASAKAAPKISPVIDDTRFLGSDSGLTVPTRRQISSGHALRIQSPDSADPPAPYRPGGVPRTQSFNANVFSITAEPKMPVLSISCALDNIDPATAPIFWRFQTLYVVGRYQKVSPGLSPHYASRVLSLGDTWSGTSRSAQFKLFTADANVTYDNASDRVAGGDAILTLAVQIPHSGDWLQDYVHLRIGAANPTEANVRLGTATAFATRDINIMHMANAVFSHENKMHQFDPVYRTHEKYSGVLFQWPSDPENFPSVAFDFGIGLAQFTHPGAETVAICWDWRENLKSGINELLDDLRRTYAPNLTWQAWATRAWSTYNAGTPTSPAGLAYAATLLALPDGKLISPNTLPAGFDLVQQTAPLPMAPFAPPARWPPDEPQVA